MRAMTRRSLFGTVLAALVAPFLPKPKPVAPGLMFHKYAFSMVWPLPTEAQIQAVVDDPSMHYYSDTAMLYDSELIWSDKERAARTAANRPVLSTARPADELFITSGGKGYILMNLY